MTQLTARMESGKALLIAGLREHYTMETARGIPELWHRLSPYFGSIPGQVGSLAYGVVTHPRDGSEGFDYMAGVEVSGVAGLPQEFATVTLPAQQYRVYEHPGHVSKLRETMQAIWKEWIAVPGRKSGERLDVVERYGEGFDTKTGYGGIEVLVPDGSGVAGS